MQSRRSSLALREDLKERSYLRSSSPGFIGKAHRPPKQCESREFALVDRSFRLNCCASDMADDE